MSDVLVDQPEEVARRTDAQGIGRSTPHPNPLPQGERGQEQDETRVSEVTISPDGRVFVFGASRGVLEVLAVLEPGNEQVGRLLERTKALRQGTVGASEAP